MPKRAIRAEKTTFAQKKCKKGVDRFGGQRYNHPVLKKEIFLSSSMAEHSAVNRRVVGSSPTWGARNMRPILNRAFFFFSFLNSSSDSFLADLRRASGAPDKQKNGAPCSAPPTLKFSRCFRRNTGADSPPDARARPWRCPRAKRGRSAPAARPQTERAPDRPR